MKTFLRWVQSLTPLPHLICADCGAPTLFSTLGRTEDKVGRWGKEQYRRKKCWSPSLSPFISVSLFPPSLLVIQYADCSSTENWLPRYAAWPIYHIDQLIKKSDVHRRLDRNMHMREIMTICTFWQEQAAPTTQRLSLADMAILLTWFCNIWSA